MGIERREGISTSRLESEKHDGQKPRSLLDRRQAERRESDRIMNEHELTEDERKCRELARVAFDAMTAVRFEEDRRTVVIDRRKDDEIVPSSGIPLGIF